MDQDDVKAALAAKRDEGSVLRRLGGIKQIASTFAGRGLPSSVRTLVTDAFGAAEYSRFTMVSQKRGAIGEAFKEYGPADWQRAISTLLPQFAASAEAACAALANRPYQDGLTRKPFRCPRSSTVADVRGRWLLNTTLLVGEYN